MANLVNAANCSVESGAGGAWVITKTGGQASAADASAVSSEGFAEDFVLRARALGAGVAYVGVSANPLVGTTPATLDRAVQISNGSGRGYDAGVLKPPLFAIDTYVWLRRTGNILQCLTGPDLATAAVKRTVTGVSGMFFFDSALVTLGVSLEIRFDLPSAFAAKRARRPLSVAIGL